MSHVRCLKIPPTKVRLLSPKEPHMLAVNGIAHPLELMVPNDAYMRWADIIQQHPSDNAVFYCAATANYPFRYLGELEELAQLPDDYQHISAQDAWNRSCCLLLIHGDVAAQWLIDNPVED